MGRGNNLEGNAGGRREERRKVRGRFKGVTVAFVTDIEKVKDRDLDHSLFVSLLGKLFLFYILYCTPPSHM